jgi:hypothetical protein
MRPIHPGSETLVRLLSIDDLKISDYQQSHEDFDGIHGGD